MEKEINILNKKNKNLIKEKEKIVKEKQVLEKDNKVLKKNVMQSRIELENNKSIQKSNIMESQIYMDDEIVSPNKKNKNNLIGQNLKGSIMPLGNFGEIKEDQNEDFGSNNTSKKQSANENLKGSDFVFGGKYIGDDDDDLDDFVEEPKKEEKKDNKNNKLKKSSLLGMSLNNNLFGFNNQYDENVAELKMEINDLYKKRDKMEDELNDKDEQLKQSILDNEQLKKLIEQKNKEIEDLKNK